MGKPRFSRKKFETPSHPWEEARIEKEDELINKYGLRNKKEVWKAETKLRKYRSEARSLLAKLDREEEQAKKESEQLLMHLTRLNILPPNSNLDDVLALETESILSRRLQTITYLKGLANTPKQARQLIIHGHISVDGKKVSVPSYMVAKKEENRIEYTPQSPLNDTMHPERPKGESETITTGKTEAKPKKKEQRDKTEKKTIKKEKKTEEKTSKKEKEEKESKKEKTDEKKKKETSGKEKKSKQKEEGKKKSKSKSDKNESEKKEKEEK